MEEHICYPSKHSKVDGNTSEYLLFDTDDECDDNNNQQSNIVQKLKFDDELNKNYSDTNKNTITPNKEDSESSPPNTNSSPSTSNSVLDHISFSTQTTLSSLGIGSSDLDVLFVSQDQLLILEKYKTKIDQIKK